MDSERDSPHGLFLGWRISSVNVHLCPIRLTSLPLLQTEDTIALLQHSDESGPLLCWDVLKLDTKSMGPWCWSPSMSTVTTFTCACSPPGSPGSMTLSKPDISPLVYLLSERIAVGEQDLSMAINR